MTTHGADYRIDTDDAGRECLALSGSWSATGLGFIAERLKRELDGRRVESLDLSSLERFDTAGALALRQSADVATTKALWQARPEAGSIYKTVARL